ncbi:N-acetylmuramoyl-L-alanine amidase [Bacillus wiedmannii]|uniref:GH25 family lysozyme n=1 Tax=Bacillus wiedmannii TaxID=1890302 RepID=UPI001CC024C1|nr:GH25 family lysozyme [Bacillus wiedmannii]MBZ4223151.1 N-acetylmuramoyl-L-alanine amidase [Bacillus wiedmannii]
MGYIVDISKWNDKINWSVAGPQLDLAICRVQYGSEKVDELYNQHVSNLEARGIPHAAYAYGCFVSVADAIVEAKDFMNRVNSRAKFLVLDVEDDTVASMKSTGNLNDLAKASQAFIDTCKAAGWKIGFYASHHMYNQYGLRNVKADFVWLPRYGSNDGKPQVKPAYPCELWQYTDNGFINGIGRVDINLLNGDKTLSWLTGESKDKPNFVPKPNEDILGYLTTTGETANIRKEPDINSSIIRQAVKGQGHTYFDWSYDGSHFWYKVDENNWMRDDVVSINKDGKSKGVVWVSGTNINLRKGASESDVVVNKITKQSSYDVHHRYENWIYVTGESVEGWMYFDESYVKWIR